MSVFGSGGDSGREAQGRGPVRDNNLSIVAPGMTIVGELTTDGVVKVEGAIEGCVRAGQQVVVAKGGKVTGDVHSREAIIGGNVVGGIYADERVEIQRGSVINGDIEAQRIVVQEGAEVNGHVRMGRPTRAARHAASQAAERKPQRQTAPTREPAAPVGAPRP